MKTTEATTRVPDGTGAHELGAWRLCLDVESLRRDAWRLQRQDGRSIDLTRAECALIACLFASAARRVSCDEVTRVILGACAGPGNRQRRTTANLPVTVGRLRSKGRRAGLEIPIRLDDGSTPSCCWVAGDQDR